MRASLGRPRTGCGAARRTSLAALLAVMFVAFIVQIVFRYFFNFPIGWTSELIGHRLAVAGALGRRLRASRKARRSASTSSTGRSAPAHRRIAWASSPRSRSWSCTPPRSRPRIKYVSFMKVEKTSYLKIRFDWLFSIYVLFLVAVIVRYVWILSQLLRGRTRRRRLDPVELRAVNLASPFSLAVMAIVAPQPARAADRPRDDRRLDALSVHGRPRRRHRRRAAAQRHVQRASCCWRSRCSSSPPSS